MSEQELHNQIEANDLVDELSDEALDRAHQESACFSGRGSGNCLQQ